MAAPPRPDGAALDADGRAWFGPASLGTKRAQYNFHPSKRRRSLGCAKDMSSRCFKLLAFSVVIFGAGCAAGMDDPGLGALVSDQEERARAVAFERRAARLRWLHQVRLEGVLTRLLLAMPDPPQVAVEVAACDAVNAYVAGGKIQMCLGMARFVQSDDEVAVILGHELAHLPTSAEHGLTGGARGDEERLADLRGLLYAHRGGYDIRLGAKVFERMAVELVPGPTDARRGRHPGHAERVVLAERIARILESGHGSRDPEGVLQHLRRHLMDSDDLP